MHELLVDAIVKRCRERLEAGDCPPPLGYSVEQLENAIIDLASMPKCFHPPVDRVICPACDGVGHMPPASPASPATREEPLMTIAKFEKQTYGAVVATILETDDSIVEVQERNDGVYGLIVHHRPEDRDQWDDLTAYLKPEHFDALGSVARRMRGAPSMDKLIEDYCRCVAELPDRTSPDDWPEAMLITGEELAELLRDFAFDVIRDNIP